MHVYQISACASTQSDQSLLCRSMAEDPKLRPLILIRHKLLFGRSRPNSVVISQIWQLPLHFQAAPNIFTII